MSALRSVGMVAERYGEQPGHGYPRRAHPPGDRSDLGHASVSVPRSGSRTVLGHAASLPDQRRAPALGIAECSLRVHRGIAGGPLTSFVPSRGARQGSAAADQPSRKCAAILPITAGSVYRRTMRGYTQDKDAYLKRLRRIEGQIRGLQRMVEDDTYCIDVLTQISAATRALQAVALGLLEDHLGHCVTQAIEDGGPEAQSKVKEAAEAVSRLVRS